MSIELQNIIDEEELIQDCNKLAELKRRNDLISKIDEIRNEFIDDNVKFNDYDTTLLIFKLVDQIKCNIINL